MSPDLEAGGVLEVEEGCKRMRAELVAGRLG